VGTQNFRFFAEIFYDIEKLRKDLEEEYQYELDRIVHHDDSTDR